MDSRAGEAQWRSDARRWVGRLERRRVRRLVSNIRANLYHGTSKDVIVNQSMIPLFREDEVQVMMSVESGDEGLGLECIKPKGEPVIPSIILSMRMVEEYDELLEEQIFG